MKFKNCLFLIVLLAVLSGGNAVFAASVPIYRLYNEATGEHLYTSDKGEYDILIKDHGWTGEDIGWNAPDTGDHVYRLYNPILNGHLYTLDKEEMNILIAQYDWLPDNNGEPLFYSGGFFPVYRLYNPELNGFHHLTTDEGEYMYLPEVGWEQENVAFYGLGDSTYTGSTDLILLDLDENNAEVNENKKIKIETQLKNIESNELNLYKNDSLIGNLVDDGTNGDELAGDKIYTYTDNVNESSPQILNYKVISSNGVESKPEEFYILEKNSSQLNNLQNEIDNKFDSIYSKYATNNYITSENNLKNYLNESKEYAKKLKEENQIIEYSESNDAIFIKHRNGVNSTFQPSIEGYLAGGSRTASAFIFDQSFDKGITKTFSKSIEDLSATCEINQEIKKENSFNLNDFVNSCASNKLIFIHSHGGDSGNEKIGSALVVKEPYSDNKTFTDQNGKVHTYKELRDSGYICKFTKPENCIGITPKFIRKFCKSLDNSVLVIGACHVFDTHEGEDSIGETFKNKGAKVVIGANKIFYAYFATRFLGFYTDYLTEQIGLGKNTTFKNAYDITSSEEGNSNVDFFQKHDGYKTYEWYCAIDPEYGKSKMHFIGSTAYSLYDFLGIKPYDPNNKPIVVLSPDFSDLDNVGLVPSLNVAFKAEGSNTIKDLGSHSNGWLIGSRFGGCVLYPNEVEIGEYYLTFTNENTGKTYTGSTKVTEKDLSTSEEEIGKTVKMKEGNGPTIPDVDNPSLIAYPSYMSATSLPNSYHVYFRPEGSQAKDDLGVKSLDGNGNITIDNIKPGIYFFVNTDWNTSYAAMIGAIRITQDQIDAKRNIRTDFWLVPDEYFRDEYGYDF